MTFRPPLVLKVEPKDPNGTAIRAYTDIDTGTLQTTLKGQDTIHRGPGQTTTYDYPNPRGYQRGITLLTHTYLALALTVQPFHQTDWPVPKGPVGAITQRTWTDSFKLPLTTHKPPYTEYNWPNPKGYTRNEILSWSQPGQAFITLPPTPTAQTDWPNPRGPLRNPQDWIQRTPQEILSSIVPFSLTDWPNPKGPPPRNPADWLWGTSQNILSSIVPFSQEDWPNPRGALRGNPDWFLGTYQGILSSIVPFNQEDWPNPRGYTRNEQLGWSQTGNAYITPPPAPFAQSDWPNPQPLRYSVEWGTWTRSFLLPLTTVVPPSIQYDWPNPRGYTRNEQLSWSQPGTSYLIPPPTPFVQTDWPVPKGKEPTHLRTWTDSFKLPLQAGVSVPFAQDDWPVPKGYQPSQWRTWTDSFKLPLTTVAPPFLQEDWPNPRAAERSIELRTWLQTGYLEEVGEPFNQTDWPVPKGPQRLTALSWTDSFKLPLTTVAPPFIQQDWPVPKSAKSVDGFTFEGLSRSTAVVVYPATITFDYPNPRGYQFSIQFRTWTDSFKLPLTTVRPPNLQRDWPNPRGPKGTISLLTWTDSFKLPLQTIRPKNQLDWPNPRGPRRNPDFNAPALTFLTSVPVVQAPFALTDWPNPKGYIQPVVQWTLDRFKGKDFCPATLDVDHTSPEISLSPDDLTATKTTAGGAGNVQAFSTSDRLGKYVYKFTVDNDTAFDAQGIGIADGWSPIGDSSILTYLGIDTDSIALYPSSGRVYFNNAIVATVDTVLQGGSGLVAFDSDAKLVWFRTLPNGLWNADPGADPATGTGGIDFTGFINSGIFAALSLFTQGSQYTFDFNPLASLLPDGFLGWCPPGIIPPPPTPAKAMTSLTMVRAGRGRSRTRTGRGRTRPTAGSGRSKPGHDP